LCITAPSVSRKRWRPGLLLCVIGVAAGVWLTLLNIAAAGGALPYALHGRSVTVTITSCTPGVCRGDYHLGALTRADEPVTGAETARVGATVRATVDGRHPGEATTQDSALVAAEATALALAGIGVTAASLRAAVRAARRPRVARTEPEETSAPADDPLAWARRRRFGAR
jgi:hypothetical protein